jgi:hypothetical protein
MGHGKGKHHGKGRNHGKSIWSRQMEYAAMNQNTRIELSSLRNSTRASRPPRPIVVPQHIPPNKEQLMTMLRPINKYQISIKEENKDAIIIAATGRREAERRLNMLQRIKKYVVEKVGKWAK